MTQESFDSIEKTPEPEQYRELKRIPLEEGRDFVLKQYSNGNTLLVLEENGKDRLNFNTEIFPADVRMELGNVWETNVALKMIEIGPWEDGRRIVSLFHELGHIHVADFNKRRELVTMKGTAGWYFSEFDNLTENQKKYAAKLIRNAESETLKDERAAWVWGLLKMKQVSHDYGIDLFAAFPKDKNGSRHIGTFVNSRLNTYKSKAQKFIKEYVPRLTDEEITELLDGV